MRECFKLHAPWPLSGDQPKAVNKLIEGLKKGYDFQTLLGVTGSGKTYTMAHVIQYYNRPTLIIAHNKTLAAQLYSEFKEFFPENEVHYFVSYYDYYQPEAYLPQIDVYIEKDASINEKIEKLRLDTTRALLERDDVIVVASVSCIYGIGKRKAYEDIVFKFRVGEIYKRREFLERLINLYYEGNDYDFKRGTFRVRGDIVDVYMAYSDVALRIEFFDDEIDAIWEIEPVSGKIIRKKDVAVLYPAKHYVTDKDAIKRAVTLIEMELKQQVEEFLKQGKVLEAKRLEARTRYDMEMLLEVGYCSGIENYSRYLDGRQPGEPPGTLLDFFPDDFLMFIDESHITIPQIRGMYNGDRARKQTLVDYGFRLPSCLDNRPLRWEEFQEYMKHVIFVSATPGDYELSVSKQIVEQIIRPTGIVDPELEIRPAITQVDDLIGELRKVVSIGDRAIVTTLTKKMAEDLAEYLSEFGFRVKYIHSELDAIQRAKLLRDLRSGEFDVIVGINLLREGIDLPEVSFVAILDADKTGFLRSYRSLIQVIGRAARNVRGKVILYADEMTDALRQAVAETERRRKIQIEYNKKHGIKPKTISKAVKDLLPVDFTEEKAEKVVSGMISKEKLSKSISELEKQMWKAVERLDFEEAARIRDKIYELKEHVQEVS